MADYLNIAGRVRTTASDGVGIEAQEVKDLNLNKSQQEINADVQTELGDRYTKEETYNREEIEELVDPTNYVSVVATDATTAVTDILPSTGEADTIYRVGNWNGTQYDPTMYALFAWNGSAYVCLAVRSFVGEVYDISVNHLDGQGNPTPYADLAAALGNGGANIPADIRRGGMRIQFVQSSDNKYVQYRLTAQNFSTTESDWQGVDVTPKVGSKNFVESGGVESKKIDTLDINSQNTLFKNGFYNFSFLFTNNAVSGTTGEQTSETPLRASTPELYYAPIGVLEFTVQSGYLLTVFKFDSNKNYIGNYTNTTYVVDNCFYFRLHVIKGDGSVITPSEASNAIQLKCRFVQDSVGILNTETENISSDLYSYLLKMSANLLNPNKVLPSTRITTTSIGSICKTGSDSSYKSVLDIPVKAGVSYNIGNSHRLAVVYDALGVIRQTQTTSQSGIYTITPIIDGYIGITFVTNESRIWFGESSKINQYVPYTTLPQTWLRDIIDKETEDLRELIICKPNLVNPNDILLGTAINNSAIGNEMSTYENDTYNSIIGIPVKAGVSYNIGDSHRLAVIYDSNGIIRQKQSDNQTGVYTITSEIDGYLGFSSFTTVEHMWAGKSNEITSYIPYGMSQPASWLLFVVNTESILKGKTIYNFGDSVSKGLGNIVDGALKGGPAKLVADKCGMICSEFAVGGASICDDTPTRSWILNQIQNAPTTAPDFVLLAGGINDLKFTTPGVAPTTYTTESFDSAYINNLDVSVVSGGLEKIIFTILNKWPTTQLVYMWEHKMWGHYDATHIQLHDVTMAVCKKWNVPVLDMYENGGLNLCVKSQVVLYGSTTSGTPTVTIDGIQYDGTHCNGLGYNVFYVPKLKSLLESLCS